METKITTGNFYAIITKDEEESLYTIALLDDWGPIICDNTLEGAKEKFEEAMGCALAVINLSRFPEIWTKLGKITYVNF